MNVNIKQKENLIECAGVDYLITKIQIGTRGNRYACTVVGHSRHSTKLVISYTGTEDLDKRPLEKLEDGRMGRTFPLVGQHTNFDRIGDAFNWLFPKKVTWQEV